jgi:hypothetical protein
MSDILRQLDELDGLDLVFGGNSPQANPRLQFIQQPRQQPAPRYRPGEEPTGRAAPVQPPAIAQPQAQPSQAEQQLEQLDGLDLLFGESGSNTAQSAPKMAQPQNADTGIDWAQPDDEIRAAIKMLPKGVQKTARDEWAKRRVSAERKDGAGVLQNVSDVARNLVRGTPAGSWLDEGLAGAKALMGGDYSEEVALQRARNQAIDDSSTKLGTLPLIGDVTAGGVTKLVGGILSAPLTPAVRVMQGATMLPRVVNAGATGATYGAAYGAGEGEETASSRALTGAAGAGIGLGIGAAAPLVAAGVGNVVGGVRRALTPTPNALMQYDAGAVQRVARAATDDEMATVYNPLTHRLGRNAMLADVGDNLRGQAGAIANSPGAGQTIIRRALEERRAGASDRIRRDVDRSLGRPVNIPQSVEATQTAARQAAAPLYDQFYATPIQVSENLTAILDRARASGAMDRAQRLMAIDGFDPQDMFYRNYPNSGADNPALNARFLDYIKRAVDDMAGPAVRSGERETARRYTSLAADLRNEVDNLLSPGNPAASVWAQARRTSGEGLAFEDALDMGRRALMNKIDPDEMAVEMAALTPHQVEAYRAGARSAIRSMMGEASAAYGQNADVAARRRLQSDFSQQRLRQVVENPNDARRINRRLQAESRFADTDNEVMRNSATSRRLAAQKEFPGAIERDVVSRELGQRGAFGMVLEGAYRIGNFLVAGALDERRARVAENAARMLVAQGAERDQIANALQQYIQQRQLNRNQVQAVEGIINRLMEGARQPAISAAVGE